jgi:hypothetical protein
MLIIIKEEYISINLSDNNTIDIEIWNEDKILWAWSFWGIIAIVFGYIGECVSSDYRIAGI